MVDHTEPRAGNQLGARGNFIRSRVHLVRASDGAPMSPRAEGFLTGYATGFILASMLGALLWTALT